MDFKFKPRPVKSERLILTLEIGLCKSLLTAEEAAQKLETLINGYHFREFDNLIVGLLRETKSSMWELKKMEIN